MAEAVHPLADSPPGCSQAGGGKLERRNLVTADSGLRTGTQCTPVSLAAPPKARRKVTAPSTGRLSVQVLIKLAQSAGKERTSH